MNLLRRAAGFFVSTDRRIPSDPGAHWTYLAIVLVLLVAPFFLTCPEDPEGALGLAGARLPPTCLSRRLFEATCPGCGLTRSFALLTHGRFRDSLRLHRLGIPLYLFFAYQAVFRVLCLRKPEITRSPRVETFQHYAALAMIVLLFGNWTVGFFTGSNGW